MIRQTQLTQDNFDGLLAWLAPDRESAGLTYERIRVRLTRFFEIRGCDDPQTLADESIARVASKFESLRPVDRPERVFFGFASKIHLEYLTRWKSREIALPDGVDVPDAGVRPEDQAHDDAKHECLDRCVAKLPGDDGPLVIRYYSEEKRVRMTLRKDVADELGVSMAALHTKIYRLKNVLRDCIESCLNSE